LTFLPSISGLLAQAVEPDNRLHIGIIAWIVIGLIAGFLGSKIVNKRGEGVMLDIVLGLVGSFVGGMIIHLMGFHRNGSILLSIVVATCGAILVLVIYHKVIRTGPAAR
jgi:uncharacterized membrane protein YeaQ/YmgE (transglycosylase-associated protein family)